MTSVSVFVVADGDRAASVRSVVESWTRAGLLGPSVWVTPSRVTSSHEGPPRVAAWVVAGDGTGEVDLFEHIGRHRLDLVRLVVGHLVVDAEPQAQAALAAAGRAVAELLAATLPRRSDPSFGVGCRLHRAVVVVPVTGATGADEKVFQPDWDANVVVSPEDRPDVDRSSVFVRHPGNFDGHAAAALCAVGGIFAGVEAGALDDVTAESTARAGDATVVRIGVRSVVGEDVLDRVAARALDAASLGPDGPSQLVRWARPAGRPELVAKLAADHLLARPEWAPSPPPQTSLPRRGHQPILAALRTAAAFNVRTVGAVVSWTLSRGRASAERSATGAIVGAAAGVLVTLGPRPVDDLTRVSERLLERERARLDEAMRLEAARADAPPPSTWTTTRGLALGLADGGDLGDFPEPRQGGKRELLPARVVVVAPGEAWTTKDGARIPAEDPHAMRGYQRYLQDEGAKAHAALTAAQEALRTAEARSAGSGATASAPTRTRRRRGAATSSAPADPAGEESRPPADDGAESSSTAAPATPDDGELAILRTRVDACERLVRTLREEETRFSAWFAQCAASVLWQVADDVGQRALRMRAEQERLELADAREQVPPSAELKHAQSALMARWRSGLLAWLLTTAFAVFAHVHRLTAPEWLAGIRLSREETWWLIGAVSVLVPIALTLANHRFYKAVRRYEWQVEQRVADLADEKARYVHAGHERARLELLRVALQDWTRIIGEVVHRPWSPTSVRHGDVPDDVVAAMPAAMAVARQSSRSGAVPTGVVLEAMSVVYQAGWCTRAFETAYECWEEENPSTAAAEGHRAIDLDATTSAAGPRRRLKEYWTSGAAQTVAGERAHILLVDAVREGSLVLPERVVSRVGRYSDENAVAESSFLRATATESTAFSTDTFSAPAQQARRHYVDRSLAWLPASARPEISADEIEVRAAAGSTAVRVDVSPRVSASALTPFLRPVDPDDYSMEDVANDLTGVQGVWH